VLLELAAAAGIILLLQAAPGMPAGVRHVLYGEAPTLQGTSLLLNSITQLHALQGASTAAA
jgi:hypothetical protein